MSEIHVSVTDQVMKLTQSPILASGGVNETKVVFTFCEKWDGFVKTALFYRDTEKVYYAILENDTCILPWEVYAENGTFFFTVFGDKDTTRRTAGVLRYKVGKGIVADDAMPSDPTPDVYDQIMALLAKNNEIAADLEEKRDSGYFNGEKGEKGDKGDKGDQGDPGTPGSALIDDSVASTENAWSSKNTVDKLCPTFTESGSVVTCEPVEGYPLEVIAEEGATITHCGKNMHPAYYRAETTNGIEFTMDNNVLTLNGTPNSGNALYRSNANELMSLEAGTYMFSLTPIGGAMLSGNSTFGLQDNGNWVVSYSPSNSFGGTAKTFTLTKPANLQLVVMAGGTFNNLQMQIQVEPGTVKTAWEQYHEPTTHSVGEPITAFDGTNVIYPDVGIVTVTGKANPSAIIEKLTNAIISLGGNV